MVRAAGGAGQWGGTGSSGSEGTGSRDVAAAAEQEAEGGREGGRMAAVLSSDRLEVSVDGLTLSPNAEVPHCEARPGQGEPAAGRSRAAPGSPGQAEAGGEAAEEAALSPERRWGFALEELYGLALRFFKGEAARRRGRHNPRRDRGGEAGIAASREAPAAGIARLPAEPGSGARAEPRIPREPRGAAP